MAHRLIVNVAGQPGTIRRYVSRVLGILLACAASLNLILIAAVSTEHPLVEVLRHFLMQTPLFLAGTVVLWVLLLGVWGVAGRIWATLWIATALSIIVVFATRQKIRVRHEPLVPSDLHFADDTGFLLGMTPVSTVLLVLGGVVVLGFLFYVTGQLLVRNEVHRRPFLCSRLPTLLLLRGLALLICAALIIDARHFNDQSTLRRLYDAAGSNWRPANQLLSYQINGYVGGFLSNIDAPDMDVPDGYSESRVRAIVDKYSRLARQFNATALERPKRQPNIVVILAESFSDPLRISGVQIPNDPIPATRLLLSQVPSGQVLTQKIGAGTANMEFEVLTGLSLGLLRPESDTPYQMLIPGNQQFPSAVGYFKHLGYHTAAIHPYHANMYQRQRVYPIFGFDEFIDIEHIKHRETIEQNDLISDDATFREVEDLIRKNRSPVFANVVTMQNHYAYDHKYRDAPKISAPDKFTREQLGGYLRGLSYSDHAVQMFIQRLSESQEPTLVIYYGDHLPGAYSGAVLDQNDVRTLHETPFFVWSNVKSLTKERLPTLSPTHLIPLALRAIDAPLPPYFVMLEQVRSHVPALSHAITIDSKNEEVSRTADLSPAAQRVLADYRLIQFDLAVGNRFAQSMFY